MTSRRHVPTFDEFWQKVETKAAKRGPESVERLEDLRAAFRLARELSRARKERGLSQSEVSKLTGIDQADISRYERAQGNPGFLTLSKLGRVYGQLTVLFGRGGRGSTGRTVSTEARGRRGHLAAGHRPLARAAGAGRAVRR